MAVKLPWGVLLWWLSSPWSPACVKTATGETPVELQHSHFGLGACDLELVGGTCFSYAFFFQLGNYRKVLMAKGFKNVLQFYALMWDSLKSPDFSKSAKQSPFKYQILFICLKMNIQVLTISVMAGRG